MKDVKTFVEIIGGILSALGILGGAVAGLNQTNVSRALLTHGEKEKHKLLEGFVLTVVFSLIVFALGVAICFSENGLRGTNENANATVTEVSEEQQVSEASDEIKTESDNEPEIEQSQNAETAANDESKTAGTYAVLMITVFLVLSVIISIWIWRRERKKIECKDKCSFWRYCGLAAIIFAALLLLICNFLFAMALLLKWYLILGSTCSIGFGFLYFYFIYETFPRYRDDVAEIRTVYDSKIVYLFEVKDNCVVAGDNYYFSRCDNYYLIGMDKLSKPLVSAKNEDDVLLLKKNVTCNNKTKLANNTILRFVIYDVIETNNADTVENAGNTENTGNIDNADSAETSVNTDITDNIETAENTNNTANTANTNITLGLNTVLNVNASSINGGNCVNYTIKDGDRVVEKELRIDTKSPIDWDGNVILM